MDDNLAPDPNFLPFDPFSNGRRPGRSISQNMAADGLSRPLIATVLRRWALSHDEVRRLTLYHTGERYCVGVLVRDATVDLIRELNQSLNSTLVELFPPSSLPETFIVGSEFANAPMFRRVGGALLIEKDAPPSRAVG